MRFGWSLARRVLDVNDAVIAACILVLPRFLPAFPVQRVVVLEVGEHMRGTLLLR